MAAHLACDPEPGPTSQSLAQHASYFLLAVSIRSDFCNPQKNVSLPCCFSKSDLALLPCADQQKAGGALSAALWTA